MKKVKKKISLVLIISIISILFLSGFSIGKAISKNDIKSNGKIAEPVLIVEKANELQISNVNNKGIYEFIIKNYKDNGKISDVKMKYEIELLLKDKNNIDIKIFKNNEEINIKDNKTEKYYLINNQKQEERFRIEIRCNTTNNIKEIYDNLQIKVHSEQTDKVI